MSGTPVDLNEYYSCFNCGYFGPECLSEDDAEMQCVSCGCEGGDGFGFAANDPRYRDGLWDEQGNTLENEDAEISESHE